MLLEIVEEEPDKSLNLSVIRNVEGSAIDSEVVEEFKCGDAKQVANISSSNIW